MIVTTCPLCGSKVELFGTDCYPNEGIGAECMNLKCDYELEISCSVRTNFLRDTVREAHSILFLKENKIPDIPQSICKSCINAPFCNPHRTGKN